MKYKFVKLFLFFIIFLLVLRSYSQPYLQWVSTYNDSLNTNNQLKNISRDSLGNIFVCCSGLGVMTLKYNSSGQFQWKNFFGSFNSIPVYTIATKNGNIYTAGLVPEVHGLKVVKYDESGNVLDSCSTDITWWVNEFVMDDNENCYFVGTQNINDNEVLLIKYDSSLNFKWKRTYSHTGHDWGLSLALDKNKNIYVSGYLGNSSFGYKSILIKYDSLGNQSWHKEYDGPFGMDTKGVKVICDEQNNTILGNYVQDTTHWYHFTIAKYTTNGSLIWDRYIIDTGSKTNEIKNIKVTQDCDIYILGYSGRLSTSYDYLTTKLDSSGNILWNNLYSSPGYVDDYPWSIYVDNFGNAYVTGSSVTVKYDSSGNNIWSFNNSSINGDNFDGLNIIVDKYSNLFLGGDGFTSQYNIDCYLIKYSQTVGVISQNQNVANKIYLYQNYPNPFNPNTNIKFQIKETRFVTLKIYNILGKEVATLVNEKQTPGTYEINWNALEYPSGVYFYKLTSGDYTETKRMVLIK
jgi:hypothetical protein